MLDSKYNIKLNKIMNPTMLGDSKKVGNSKTITSYIPFQFTLNVSSHNICKSKLFILKVYLLIYI